MESAPLISVIIPAYNIEKYIAQCLESIVKQTYQNIEILVVNDGSTDQTGNIIDEYARKDNRVKHLKKLNGGLSDARNYGLDRAQGDIISFIDGDDFIDLDMYECLVSAFIKHPDIDIIKYHISPFIDGEKQSPPQ